MPQIPVRDFEKAVQEIEGISIVVLAPSSAIVEEYAYKNRDDAKSSLSAWLERRVKPKIMGYECGILSPDHLIATPHGKTSLANLRARYER